MFSYASTCENMVFRNAVLLPLIITGAMLLFIHNIKYRDRQTDVATLHKIIHLRLFASYHIYVRAVKDGGAYKTPVHY